MEVTGRSDFPETNERLRGIFELCTGQKLNISLFKKYGCSKPYFLFFAHSFAGDYNKEVGGAPSKITLRTAENDGRNLPRFNLFPWNKKGKDSRSKFTRPIFSQE
jgi:hypothetical protein